MNKKLILVAVAVVVIAVVAMNYNAVLSSVQDMHDEWDNHISSDDSYIILYGSKDRIAERYSSFTGTPISVDFRLKRFGSPPGSITARVRYKDNDTIITSTKYALASNSLSDTMTWVTFTFDDAVYLSDKDIFVSFEYLGGGSGGNCIGVNREYITEQNTWVHGIGGWSDSPNSQVSIRFRYSVFDSTLDSIPGFEMLAFIASLGIAFILWRRRIV